MSEGRMRCIRLETEPLGAWRESDSQLCGAAGPAGIRRPDASKRWRACVRGLGGALSGSARRERICGGRLGVVIVAGTGFESMADLRKLEMSSFTVDPPL